MAVNRTIDSPIAVGIATLGAIPVLLSDAFLGLVGSVPTRFLVTHLLAAAVPILGISGIWYWDRRVYPRFVDQTAELVVDVDALRSSALEYKVTFTRR